MFKNTILEIETGVAILRAGTADPVVNIQLHHNSDELTKQAKHDLAGRMAEFIAQRLPVRTDRYGLHFWFIYSLMQLLAAGRDGFTRTDRSMAETFCVISFSTQVFRSSFNVQMLLF